MMRIVPIWRYSCLRCDLIKCVKWYVKCLILHKYGKMTNILCSKDNNFHSIGLLNPQNIRADINITFLLHLVLEISLLLQKSCCCGHLGGHLEFWSLHKWDSRGLLICYLWVHYGLILKKLACYEFCSPPTLMLLDYFLHNKIWVDRFKIIPCDILLLFSQQIVIFCLCLINSLFVTVIVKYILQISEQINEWELDFGVVGVWFSPCLHVLDN